MHVDGHRRMKKDRDKSRRSSFSFSLSYLRWGCVTRHNMVRGQVLVHSTKLEQGHSSLVQVHSMVLEHSNRCDDTSSAGDAGNHVVAGSKGLEHSKDLVHNRLVQEHSRKQELVHSRLVQEHSMAPVQDNMVRSRTSS